MKVKYKGHEGWLSRLVFYDDTENGMMYTLTIMDDDGKSVTYERVCESDIEIMKG